MPPALTAKCPHEPFSKPRMINPCYTHDSSDQALTVKRLKAIFHIIELIVLYPSAAGCLFRLPLHLDT